jgi:hypothetical protein
MTAGIVDPDLADRVARVDGAALQCHRPHCSDHRPTQTPNPYADWTTLELVDHLVTSIGGCPAAAYVEYGQRRERGDITGEGRGAVPDGSDG